jgi:MFS family permease
MSDGVLMALVGGICPEPQRATGMALMGTITSGGRFVAALVFGALWSQYDARTAMFAFSGALATAVVIAALTFRYVERKDDRACA